MTNAFVMVSRELHEARQGGEISAGAYCLGLHLALDANFVSRKVWVTLEGLIEELEAGCSADTMGRRLRELRVHGFIAYDIRQGQRRGYFVTVTRRLVPEVRKRVEDDAATPDGEGEVPPLPHDLRKSGVSDAEVTSAGTSARHEREEAAKTDGTTSPGEAPPPHGLPHEDLRKKEERTPKPSIGKGVSGCAHAREAATATADASSPTNGNFATEDDDPYGLLQAEADRLRRKLGTWR